MIEILNKRVTSMEETLNNAEEGLKRNKAIVDILTNVDEKKKAELKINDFIAIVNNQCGNIESQVNTLKKMIGKTKEAIDIYNTDKGRYEEILSTILESFGFEEESEKTENS